MKWATHIFASVILFVTFSKLFNFNAFYLLFALLGAIFPDLMEELYSVKHRSKIFHEHAPYLIPAILGVLYPQYFALSVFGFFSVFHLLLDSLTKTGVHFFGKRIKGSLNTESLLDNAMVILIFVFIGALVCII